MIDVMMDLETFGTRPGSAIRSVAAACFDLRGDGVGDNTFSANITAMSCWVAGLTVDRDTIAWWEKQSTEAKEVLKKNQRPLLEVANEFHTWFRKTGADCVWAQGAGFDPVLWERAALAAGASWVPWKFWNIRCTRTAYHLGGLDHKTVPRVGTAHSAADDCAHQVRCVQLAVKRIGSYLRATEVIVAPPREEQDAEREKSPF